LNRDIIVIGASAGGLSAVSAILAELPADLPASIFVVIHLFPGQPSQITKLLGRVSNLPVVHPADRTKFERGMVYVAPPDLQMMLERDRIRILRSPKENLHRPAVDPLFRTAAFYFRSRVIGVLLTGSDTDGTSGLFSIKMRGGLGIVQHPEEAHAPVMPFTAVTHLKIDHMLSVDEMGSLLTRLVINDRAGKRRNV
jgi:two-component system, chemotaxis family, protein-glutamate methylesterase/glutaminase